MKIKHDIIYFYYNKYYYLLTILSKIQFSQD